VRAFATELRNLGYRGMLLNSASTGLVPYVHEVFTPADEEVAQWQALLDRAAEADRTGERILMGDRSQGEGYYIHGSQVKAARLNMEWARALAARDGRTLPGS
jgi:citrate lyase beta subunit